MTVVVAGDASVAVSVTVAGALPSGRLIVAAGRLTVGPGGAPGVRGREHERRRAAPSTATPAAAITTRARPMPPPPVSPPQPADRLGR